MVKVTSRRIGKIQLYLHCNPWVFGRCQAKCPSCQLENVVLFQNELSFSNCERFCECFFPFSKNTIVNKKTVHLLQIALLMRLYTNNEISIKLLNLFHLPRIYNLLHQLEYSNIIARFGLVLCT